MIGLRQFASQQISGIGFGEELGFKIQAGRKAEVSVGRASETIDATMLTTAIGINGDAEGEVRRLVVAENGFGGFDMDFCFDLRLSSSFMMPTVIHPIGFLGFEATGDIADSTATFKCLWFGRNPLVGLDQIEIV